MLEDSFLYTITPGDLTCINVADPEDIFIYRTYSPAGANTGLTALGGFAYTGGAYTFSDDSTFRAWPRVEVERVDMINSATPEHVSGGYYHENRFFGDLATDGDFVFHVNTEMSDGPAWTVGESNLYVLGTDTSYNFVSHWDGQGVFGVDVIGDDLLAVGFEHGVSILNITDLDDIYEAAYYIDTLGNIDITHFAIKENRLYAMGHPRSGYATLYMFELDNGVVYGISEATPAKPAKIAISAYPNPFNSAVRIVVDCHSRESGNPEGAAVEIFDLNGRCVAELPGNRTVGEALVASRNAANGDFPETGKREGTSPSPTTLEFTWSPDESLPSGVYLVRARVDPRSLSGAEATTTTAVKRVVYLK